MIVQYPVFIDPARRRRSGPPRRRPSNHSPPSRRGDGSDRRRRVAVRLPRQPGHIAGVRPFRRRRCLASPAAGWIQRRSRARKPSLSLAYTGMMPRRSTMTRFDRRWYGDNCLLAQMATVDRMRSSWSLMLWTRYLRTYFLAYLPRLETIQFRLKCPVVRRRN